MVCSTNSLADGNFIGKIIRSNNILINRANYAL